MNGKIKWIIGVIVAGLLVMAFAIPALAAGPTPTPTPNSSGVGPGWGGGYGHGMGYGVGGIDDTVTKLLGMTAEQIQAERQSGKSLVQIASSKTISEDVLINAILVDRKADLQKLVDAKTITQDLANQRLEFMKTQIKTMVERTTVGPPDNRGMRGGFAGTGTGNTTGAPGAFGRGGGMMGRGWR